MLMIRDDMDYMDKIMNPLWMVKTRFQIMADTSLGQRAFKNYGNH